MSSISPFTDVDAAIAAAEVFEGEVRKFELAVADYQQVAPIADRALERGWELIGFVQRQGFRLYRCEAVGGSMA